MSYKEKAAIRHEIRFALLRVMRSSEAVEDAVEEVAWRLDKLGYRKVPEDSVVLDLSRLVVPVSCLVSDLRDANWKRIADEIEAQTKPLIPPEPGKGAVVTTEDGQVWVRWWVRTGGGAAEWIKAGNPGVRYLWTHVVSHGLVEA